MKRSEILRIMTDSIIVHQLGGVQVSLEAFILKNIEKAGMLPPNSNPDALEAEEMSYEWEPENA